MSIFRYLRLTKDDFGRLTSYLRSSFSLSANTEELWHGSKADLWKLVPRALAVHTPYRAFLRAIADYHVANGLLPATGNAGPPFVSKPVPIKFVQRDVKVIRFAAAFPGDKLGRFLQEYASTYFEVKTNWPGETTTRLKLSPFILFHQRNDDCQQPASPVAQPTTVARSERLDSNLSSTSKSTEAATASTAAADLQRHSTPVARPHPAIMEHNLEVLLGDAPRQQQAMPQVSLLTKARECAQLVESMANCRICAIDCEGVKLSKNGVLCLIQIYVPESHRVFIVDVFGSTEKAAVLRELRKILESPNIVKVLHDCRQDAASLMYRANIRLVNVVDTQVMYATLKFLHACAGYTNHMDPIPRRGLNSLLQKYNLATNGDKLDVKALMDADAALWKRRPLSPQLLSYAAGDVVHLLPLMWAIQSDIRRFACGPMVARLSHAHAEWYYNAPDRVLPPAPAPRLADSPASDAGRTAWIMKLFESCRWKPPKAT